MDSLLRQPDEELADETYSRFVKALQKNSSRLRPVLRSLLSLHRNFAVFGVLLATFHIVCQTLNPLLLRSLIAVMPGSGGHSGGWDPLGAVLPNNNFIAAIILSFLMLASAFGMIAGAHHSFFSFLRISSRIRSQLTVAIYAKSLRLSREAKQEIPGGNIVNLMASDINKLCMMTLFIHSFFNHPFQIVLIMTILYTMLGWPVFAGAAVMLLLLGISVGLARFNAHLRRKLLKVTDERISVVNEVLTHIRVIKLYGWEKSFLSQVGKLRDREVSFLRSIALVAVGISALFQSAPVLIAAATFTTISLIGSVPPAADLLPAIALYALLRWSMTTLPETIVLMLEANVAIRRIEDFLALPEHKDMPQDPSLEKGAISFSGFSADWSPGIPSLKNIRLEIAPGEIVCIVGRIGSGKSALLRSILGELRRSSGQITMHGRPGYVSQHPWIVNDTILSNITLGRNFEADRYKKCLNAAALGPDISAFPGLDQTEIGERGVNLSGGQKQRISLARAAYADSDIYLLDDPFSALDPSVGEDIYRDLLGGILRGKTILLVTHRLEFAGKADRILIMDHGQLAEQGRASEIIASSDRYRLLKDAYEAEKHAPAADSPEASLPVSASVPLSHADPASDPAPFPDDNSPAGALIVEEERRTGNVGRTVYIKYLSVFAPGALLLLMLSLFAVRDMVQIGNDTWLSRWSLGKVEDTASFLKGYVLLVSGLVLISFMRSFFVRIRGLKAGTSMHHDLLRGVLRAPLSFFDSNPTGRILSRFSGDIEAVDHTIPGTVVEVFSSASAVIAAVVLIVIVNPLLVFGIPPLVMLYYSYQALFRPTIIECQRLDSITRSPVFAQYSESLAGLSSIRAFGWGDIFIPRLISYVDRNQACFFSIIAANRWLGIRLESLGALMVFAAALMPVLVPSYLGAAGAGLAVVYAISITGALNWFIRMLVQIESSMNSVERIDYYSSVGGEKWEGKTPPSAWPESGNIEFRNVEVRYRSEHSPVLRGISAKIRAGERIGIAGRTGAGKSTLVLALSRLVEPSGGDIFIDGVSILDLSLEELRSAIAVIPQDPVMFLGTIRSNLDPFSQFSDAQIHDALKRTHIDRFIISLPGGLSGVVHEGGANFSAGQRQLICLARALLRNNRIIVLDEATASVDAETDALIQATIRKEFSGKTILTIAHRLATILDYDQIMILDRGRLAEFDTPAGLRRRAGGLFREMIEAG